MQENCVGKFGAFFVGAVVGANPRILATGQVGWEQRRPLVGLECCNAFIPCLRLFSAIGTACESVVQL